jgi:hypothetical protein
MYSKTFKKKVEVKFTLEQAMKAQRGTSHFTSGNDQVPIEFV